MRILWQLRIGTYQKLAVGASLSLSICMVIFACIRIAGCTLRHCFGITWQLFWLQVEASIAVCMVSVTAFRSIFLSEPVKAGRKKPTPWYSSTVAGLRRRKKFSEELRNLEGLPTIPSATLSGMRTFIRGSGVGFGSGEDDDIVGYEPLYSVDSRVHVTRGRSS